MASGRNMWEALEKQPAILTKKLNAPKNYVQPVRTRGGRVANQAERVATPKSYAQPLRAKGSGIATRTENAMAKKGSEYRRRLEEQMASQRNWGRRKFR